MHCDRNLDDSEGSMRDRLGDRKDVMSERDERKAQYWTRKLYEFEANDPDRYCCLLLFSWCFPLFCMFETFSVITKLCSVSPGGATVALRSFILRNLILMGKEKLSFHLINVKHYCCGVFK